MVRGLQGVRLFLSLSDRLTFDSQSDSQQLSISSSNNRSLSDFKKIGRAVLCAVLHRKLLQKALKIIRTKLVLSLS